MNCPTYPHSAKERAAFRGRAKGRDIYGISSILLTNFETAGLFSAGPIAEMREANASVVSSDS